MPADARRKYYQFIMDYGIGTVSLATLCSTDKLHFYADCLQGNENLTSLSMLFYKRPCVSWYERKSTCITRFSKTIAFSMCSNRAIVDSLECYMDDLVECFEDFVKKSLLVISFGIGLIVALLAYLLKMVCERPPIQNIVAESAVSARNQIRNMEPKNDQVLRDHNMPSKLPPKNGQKDTLPFPSGSRVKQTTTGVNTIQRLSAMPSYDEQVLRDIGFSSCSKSGCRRRNANNDVPSRVPVPNLTSSPPKYKSIHSILLSKHNISSSQLCSKTKRGSCCSICCNDAKTH